MSQSTAHETSIPNGKDKSDVKARVEDAVEKGIETVKDTAQTAQESITDASDQAAEQLRKFGSAGTKFVRDNPGTAVAGAVGVGILLGLALRNRS